jgi:hypothetical protein
LQALEPFCAKTQVALVREFDEGKNRLDEGWIPSIESIGVKAPLRGH